MPGEIREDRVIGEDQVLSDVAVGNDHTIHANGLGAPCPSHYRVNNQDSPALALKRVQLLAF
jgi:hypothetical protein